MREINLDEARAARAEASGEPITLTFGGQTFTIPAEMSITVVAEANAGNMVGVVTELFADEGQAAAFLALRPTAGDIKSLLEQVAAANALSLGESSASTA